MTYHQMLAQSTVARNILTAGGSTEDVAVALYEELQRMTNRAVDLAAIAPFKVRAKDGREFIWRCPDEHVPLRGA